MYKVKTCGNDDQVLSTFRIIIVTSSDAMLLLVYIYGLRASTQHHPARQS